MPRKFDLENALHQREKITSLIKQNEIKIKILLAKLETLNASIELNKEKTKPKKELQITF